MRDAFGGAFMIKLMLIFLVIYVCFIAIALNYAKAFKAKNGIIDYIERYEGFNNTSETLINTYLVNMKYYVASQSGQTAQYSKQTGATCYDLGYCIENYTDGSGSNYIVATFIEVRILGLSFTVPIKGEVRIPHP